MSQSPSRRLSLLPKRERIGPAECPLFDRWTLLAPRWRGRPVFKVLLHHFAPNRQDADVPHDHPRSFVTLCLRGGYDDLVRCPSCDGAVWKFTGTGGFGNGYQPCSACGRLGLVVGDRLRAGSIRYRPADHAHMTRTDDRGAWTLVVMGPEVRPWGFWREGRWWAFREFERTFGFAWRCAEPDEGIK